MNYIMCLVDNDRIFQVDQLGRKEIGVVTKHYNDTMELLKKFQAKAQEYKKMLEDAGIIEKEKTPQEIYKEQNEMLKAIMARLNKLEEKQDGKLPTEPNQADAE